ncbi:MAG: MltA domain-containing protein [Rhizobiaceae bacterium]|nr:MltA domain-containing protein [Rhizobiaceae bacterium]
MEGWEPAKFSDLEGWENDDHQAALACFRMSAKGFADKVPISRLAVQPTPELLKAAEKALALNVQTISNSEAREFFEEHFQPIQRPGRKGFVTAYFEPEVDASRVQTREFPYPLYKRPADLVKIDKTDPPSGVTAGLEYARKTESGFTDFYNRGEIDNGALAGRGLELFWLRSAIEGFYIHVQGSARLLFQDGSSARVSYAGKTGHPYTSIGKELVAQGTFDVDQANMTNIRAWLEEDLPRAMEMLHRNQSFIFFTELKGHDPDFGPIAAAGVQLTPGRSLAVDKSIHAYGTPVWLGTQNPLPSDTKPFQRLMIAQDTGSAIVGPQRGDIFIGSGDEAGMVAGAVRHDTDFFVLVPKAK